MITQGSVDRSHEQAPSVFSRMDITLRYGRRDVGSIPAGPAINFKRRSKMKQRNIFAVLASKRKAGSHRKSNKALRRLAKVRDRGEAVSQQTFNLSNISSNLIGPTILKHIRNQMGV